MNREDVEPVVKQIVKPGTSAQDISRLVEMFINMSTKLTNMSKYISEEYTFTLNVVKKETSNGTQE